MAYFSAMEVLQAATYTVVDRCDAPANQVFTLLAVLHISFQPVFINWLALSFVSTKRRKAITPIALSVALAATFTCLLQIYPFKWAGSCEVGHILCARDLCALSGKWHLTWNFPVNGLMYQQGLFPVYVVSVFILPIMYGAWRFTLFQIVLGPFLSYFLSGGPNEWPAVWCTFSVGILILISTPGAQRILRLEPAESV